MGRRAKQGAKKKDVVQAKQEVSSVKKAGGTDYSAIIIQCNVSRGMTYFIITSIYFYAAFETCLSIYPNSINFSCISLSLCSQSRR
jgi:hypothetical protein